MLYVCSDIHGQYGLFKQMLQDIQFSEKDKLFILGDIIDRGPESIPMLLDIMNRKNIYCLMGNHEFMMDAYFKGKPDGEAWLYNGNGGQKTQKEFLQLSASEQSRILDYIRHMYVQKEILLDDTTYLLSHSYFIQKKGDVKVFEISDDDIFYVVWYSPWRMWEYVPFSEYATDKRIHIIGHVPVQSFQTETTAYVNIEQAIINIDLGCAGYPWKNEENWYGLCCMNLSNFHNKKEDIFRYYT